MKYHRNRSECGQHRQRLVDHPQEKHQSAEPACGLLLPIWWLSRLRHIIGSHSAALILPSACWPFAGATRSTLLIPPFRYLPAPPLNSAVMTVWAQSKTVQNWQIFAATAGAPPIITQTIYATSGKVPARRQGVLLIDAAA